MRLERDLGDRLADVTIIADHMRPLEPARPATPRPCRVAVDPIASLENVVGCGSRPDATLRRGQVYLLLQSGEPGESPPSSVMMASTRSWS